MPVGAGQASETTPYTLSTVTNKTCGRTLGGRLRCDLRLGNRRRQRRFLPLPFLGPSWVPGLLTPRPTRFILLLSSVYGKTGPRRVGTRDPRHADSENTGSRADARVGNCTLDPADFRRGLARRGGVPVSRASPHGAGRPDRCGMGPVGKQAQGKILPVDESRPKSSGGGSGSLAATRAGNRACDGGDVK